MPPFQPRQRPARRAPSPKGVRPGQTEDRRGVSQHQSTRRPHDARDLDKPVVTPKDPRVPDTAMNTAALWKAVDAKQTGVRQPFVVESMTACSDSSYKAHKTLLYRLGVDFIDELPPMAHRASPADVYDPLTPAAVAAAADGELVKGFGEQYLTSAGLAYPHLSNTGQAAHVAAQFRLALDTGLNPATRHARLMHALFPSADLPDVVDLSDPAVYSGSEDDSDEDRISVSSPEGTPPPPLQPLTIVHALGEAPLVFSLQRGLMASDPCSQEFFPRRYHLVRITPDQRRHAAVGGRQPRTYELNLPNPAMHATFMSHMYYAAATATNGSHNTSGEGGASGGGGGSRLPLRHGALSPLLQRQAAAAVWPARDLPSVVLGAAAAEGTYRGCAPFLSLAFADADSAFVPGDSGGLSAREREARAAAAAITRRAGFVDGSDERRVRLDALQRAALAAYAHLVERQRVRRYPVAGPTATLAVRAAATGTGAVDYVDDADIRHYVYVVCGLHARVYVMTLQHRETSTSLSSCASRPSRPEPCHPPAPQKKQQQPPPGNAAAPPNGHGDGFNSGQKQQQQQQQQQHQPPLPLPLPVPPPPPSRFLQFTGYDMRLLALLDLGKPEELLTFVEWHRRIVTWGTHCYATRYVADLRTALRTPDGDPFRSVDQVTQPYGEGVWSPPAPTRLPMLVAPPVGEHYRPPPTERGGT